MIAVVDYGVGNLFSLKSSLTMIGAESIVTSDPAALKNADRILLPGVGAFGDAADKLRASGLFDVVREEALSGKPMLGICLGMQLLFDKSYEYGEHDGLGLIPGSVKPMKPLLPETLKVPHIGWNRLDFPADKPKSPLFKYLSEGEYVYFVHSFAAMDCTPAVIATSEYGFDVTAAVQRGNVFGTQFHPEKSGNTGLNILRAFAEWKETDA